MGWMFESVKQKKKKKEKKGKPGIEQIKLELETCTTWDDGK